MSFCSFEKVFDEWVGNVLKMSNVFLSLVDFLLEIVFSMFDLEIGFNVVNVVVVLMVICFLLLFSR